MKEKDKSVVSKIEIAQWVINNRYPKNEKEKVSDHEMYFHILEAIDDFASLRVKEEFDKKIKEIEQAWDECYQSLRYTIDLGEGGKFNEQQFDRYKKHFLDKIILDNKL